MSDSLTASIPTSAIPSSSSSFSGIKTTIAFTAEECSSGRKEYQARQAISDLVIDDADEDMLPSSTSSDPSLPTKPTDMIPWQEVYDQRYIKNMFQWQSDVYVVRKPYDKELRFTCVSFSTGNCQENIRNWRINMGAEEPRLKYIQMERGIEPHYTVTRDSSIPCNLFVPTWPLNLPLMVDTNKKLPSQYEIIFNNLCGDADPTVASSKKHWLLNHMATYFKTLEKPRTIPVVLSVPGAGKNVLFEAFGELFGDYRLVEKGTVDSQFTEWKKSAVIQLDEIFVDVKDIKKNSSQLKSLINSDCSINAKGRSCIQMNINSYYVVTSNEHLPIVIESNDRRYTVIHNLKQSCHIDSANNHIGAVNLATIPEWDYTLFKTQHLEFAQFLASYPIDINLANTVLETAASKIISEQCVDPVIAAVKLWLSEHKVDNPNNSVTFKDIATSMNNLTMLTYPIRPEKLRPILMELGVHVHMFHNKATLRGYLVPPGELNASMREGRIK